ncbi:hypothetical protein D3C76_868660 [compost metagenome]
MATLATKGNTESGVATTLTKALPVHSPLLAVTITRLNVCPKLSAGGGVYTPFTISPAFPVSPGTFSTSQWNPLEAGSIVNVKGTPAATTGIAGVSVYSVRAADSLPNTHMSPGTRKTSGSTTLSSLNSSPLSRKASSSKPRALRSSCSHSNFSRMSCLTLTRPLLYSSLATTLSLPRTH